MTSSQHIWHNWCPQNDKAMETRTVMSSKQIGHCVSGVFISVPESFCPCRMTISHKGGNEAMGIGDKGCCGCDHVQTDGIGDGATAGFHHYYGRLCNASPTRNSTRPFSHSSTAWTVQSCLLRLWWSHQDSVWEFSTHSLTINSGDHGLKTKDIWLML